MELMSLPFKGGSISKDTRVLFACSMWSVTFIAIKMAAIYTSKAIYALKTGGLQVSI